MSPLNLVAIVLAVLFCSALIYQIRKNIKKKNRRKIPSYWSIGFQFLAKPFDANPSTATVYSKHDMPADTNGLADPFLFMQDGIIYLFYEIIVNSSSNAKIAFSTFNQQQQHWDFQSIVIDEPFHLSYPYIFSHNNHIYMIPETKHAKSVRLYRATQFPSQWAFEKTLIDDKKFVDSSIIFWQGQFFLFTSRKRTLHLYYSKSLTGDWLLHPKSPIKRRNYARCAGRIFEHQGKLFRFAQEQAKGYGMGLKRYNISKLTANEYIETPMDKDLFFEPCGDSWAQRGMHHLDILKVEDDKYLAVFDGRGMPKQPTQAHETSSI